MATRRLLLFLILLFSSICSANNPVGFFEPKITTLKGVVTELIFPGAPNYESIKKGDTAEKGVYLILSTPVDIVLAPNAGKSYDTPTKNVQIIQLVVLNNQDWKAIKKGNTVEITGKLSSPITGHHHARALLDVDKVKMLSTQKIDNHLLNVIKEDKYLLKNQPN